MPGEASHFHGFWCGPPLGPYELLSLASLVQRGQRVSLYSYDQSLQVPDGVELLDAGDIVPAAHVREFVYASGERSPALHSNLVRYAALERYGGWYFDLDVVLLAAQPPADELYLARQDDGLVNGAIMKLPAGSALCRAAIEHSRGRVDAASREWGLIGPRLLTELVDRLGLASHVRPWECAYPVRPTEAVDAFLPEHAERLHAQAATADFVHLWNEIWRRLRIPKNYGPPAGSFLDGLFRRFGFEFRPESRLSAEAIRSWQRDYAFLQSLQQRFPRIGSWEDMARAVEERDQMAASTSWKLTAPLRGFANLLSRRNGPAE